jgi:rhamnose transport system permease protein
MMHRREISIAAAIAGMGAVLGIAAPGFFTWRNQLDLLLANMPVLIAALGMTLVILTGQIDISIGSQFGVASVAAGVFAKLGLPIALVGLCACLAGALFGAVNGVLAARARIPSIVVTLAMMVALRDGLRWITQGAWVQDLPPSFQWFGLPQPASQAITIAATLLLLFFTAWALRNLAAGRAVYAAGSNAEAARLAGIDPTRIVFAVFVLSGALAGCAAFFNAVRFNQVPSNAGIGLEMKVIAAVIVGGASVTGGRGTIFGTFLGVLLLGSIGPALTFLGINAYWERAIQGAMILISVSLDAVKYAGSPATQRA